jgi:hypothetical protein
MFSAIKPVSCTVTLPNNEVNILSKTSACIAIGAATNIFGIKLITHALQQDSEKRLRDREHDTTHGSSNMPGHLIRNCAFGVGLITIGIGLLSYSTQLACTVI